MEILAAFAHPDDETIMIGGTLAMLSSKGAVVHILSATRGEGGELGEPPLSSRAELGRVREEEFQCAAQALGARSAKCLDFVDPLIAENGDLRAFEANVDILASQLQAEMESLATKILITHGSNGEYGHPAHRLMHEAAFLTSQHSDGVDLYTVSANFPGHPRPRLANEDDEADIVLNIEEWFPAKLAAAYCHRTQHALFVRRQSKRAGRQLSISEALMKKESLHRAWPDESKGGEDPLSQFIHQECPEAIIEG
ncbi:MAG: hypothetical protein GTO18_21540 [Anaerolineales bacterium]|nr:hypothetical protein [Anaerolineales bacterium]